MKPSAQDCGRGYLKALWAEAVFCNIRPSFWDLKNFQSLHVEDLLPEVRAFSASEKSGSFVSHLFDGSLHPALKDLDCTDLPVQDARAVFSLEKICEAAFASPFLNIDPLAEILVYLIAKEAGRVSPPLIPRLTPLSVAELCELALLWACAGFFEAAEALSRSIPIDFPWLWCQEKEFSEKQTAISIRLLRRVLGHDIGQEAQDVLEDRYFIALSQKTNDLPVLNGQLDASPGLLGPGQASDLMGRSKELATHYLNGESPSFRWSLLTVGSMKCAITFSGSKVSHGALLSRATEIRAFGPQARPLSDPATFGIREILDHSNRWASPIANPEIWYELQVDFTSKAMVFNLNFYGEVKDSLLFSFYIKSSFAQIGNEKLKAQSLNRYVGPSKPIVLGGDLVIECDPLGKMEVIPLAGGGGFWDCEYLAAFEVHPMNPKMSFKIYTR